jgi:hypothetical protein
MLVTARPFVVYVNPIFPDGTKASLTPGTGYYSSREEAEAAVEEALRECKDKGITEVEWFYGELLEKHHLKLEWSKSKPFIVDRNTVAPPKKEVELNV